MEDPAIYIYVFECNIYSRILNTSGSNMVKIISVIKRYSVEWRMYASFDSFSN